MSNILSGIRVLDCSIAMAGPFAAQRMGDMGADVIKVEPVTGEWQRHAPAGGATGTAAHLAVWESLHATLVRLSGEGYSVTVPETVDDLR